MHNAQNTPLSTSDLRTTTGGGYYALPVFSPIYKLPITTYPDYPTTDPVNPPIVLR